MNCHMSGAERETFTPRRTSERGPPMRAHLATLAFFLLSLLAAEPAEAWSFDFESTPLLGEPYRQYEGPLGLTAPGDDGGPLVTVIPGSSLRIYDIFHFAGNPYRGHALIDWRWPSGANTQGTALVFARPVAAVQLDAGDWGGDDDGPLRLTAYDCAGRQVATTSEPWPDGRVPPFARLAVQAPGICRVVYRSGGQYPGSTFIDNLQVSPQ